MGIYEKSDVGIVWRLYQYVSSSGRKAIEDWRADLPTNRRRADFDVFLRNMAKKRRWEWPDIGGLSGKHLKGFRELRWKSENVPHRIGGYFTADDEFVMLIGFTHNSRKYDPPMALEMLPKRRKQILDEESTISEYTIPSGFGIKK